MRLHSRKWLCRISVLAMVGAMLLAANYAYGQAFATITGRALDPGGASVPDATVTATNTETGIVRTTKTTSDGLFRFDNLPPGIYDVAIEKSSFTTLEAKRMKLQVGEQRDLNFNLQLAGQQQLVTVTSELPLVETTRTDVSTVIDDKSVANLPTTTSYNAIGGVANDYQGLAASAPGVRFDYSGDSSDIVGPGAVSDRGVVVNVDGGNISDQLVSSRDALGASVEEVKEFQVLSNNYNAEYGQAGNVILNVITKSGTNSVHGDFHGYFRGRNLGASDFFYNQTNCDPTITGAGSCDSKSDAGFPTRRAPFHKHEYGFTLGGPFVKDRLFWFGSWEKVQQGSPATLRPFNASVTFNQPTNEILGSGKIDAKLTDKHTLTIRYNLQRDLSDNLLVQTGPNTDPSGLVSSVVHDNGLNIGLVSTPTPNTVNEARFYWHRFLSQTPTKSQLPGQSLPSAYVGADFCCPQAALQHRFQYIDNVSYTRGAHTIKVGMSISHFPYDSLFQQFHFGRYESFSAGGCVDTPFPQGSGNCPGQFTIGAGPGFVHAADNIYGAFIQDTWQIRRSVTLNYGLRYDIEDGAFKGGSIQNSSVPGGCLQGNGLIPACSSDKNNWQPRVGVAWSPSYEHGLLHFLFGSPGKSVVRAAGAEVTQMAYLNVVLDSLNFDGTNLFTTSITAPSGNSCFLANGSANPAELASATDGPACNVLTSFPNSPSTASLAPFTQGVRTKFGRVRPISPTIHNPEIRMASFSIQRQIGQSFVFSVGFQGVYGFGLFGETDQNFPTPIADPAHPGFFYVGARPNPAFTAIRTNFSNRTSGYNSLVVTAQKRVSHHFQFQGSYTWSKTMATGEDFFGLSEPGNPLASLKLDRALAQQDIRHLGNFSFVADTNSLFHTALVNHVLNNWTFGLIGTLQSGRPYPVSTGDGLFSGSAFPALGSETNQRPNVNADGTLTTAGIGSFGQSNDNVSEADVATCNAAGLANCAQIQTTWLAPAGASGSGPRDAYTGDPVDFKFINGNLVRNAGQTLALYRFDVSLTKAFRIPKRETSSLELKLDVFNVFNHPLFILNNGNDVLNFFSLPAIGPGFDCTTNCINPYTGLYLGANGNALNVRDFRSGRVDRDLNTNKVNFLGLGNPSGDVTPRIIQLAIRFRW
jgi:Carboxypeptidase regulatory-like domain